MFQRVLPSLSGFLHRKKQPTPPVEERRVWVRHPCRLETTVQPAAAVEERPVPARVRNVSRGGLLLLVDRRIEAGELVSIELPSENAANRGTVLACVLSVNAAAEGEWALSCAFSAELSEGDLRVLGIAPPGAVEAEQRTLIRFPCRATAVYEVVGGSSAERGHASVHDVSAGGIGLTTAHPITVGTLLNLWLRDGNERPIATMLASVVSARPAADGSSTLGCTLLGELSDKQLRGLA